MSPTNDPLGELRVLRWRLRFVVSMILLMGGAVVLRLCQLQGFQQREFTTRVLKQKIVRERIPAKPGDIRDRHGRLLATTVNTRSLFVVPKELINHSSQIESLARGLELSPDSVRSRVEEHRDSQFLWLKRRIEDRELAIVRGLKLPKESWGVREEYQRKYPQGGLGAHLIGLRDIDGKGRGGIEQVLDQRLRGVDGTQEMLRDARGRVIEIVDGSRTQPNPGEDVVLSIDGVLQLFAEQTLDGVMEEWKPLSCCAIVTDPQTGEVLAMASRPGFDPNHPGNVQDSEWKNRAIADVYEPGSTFKPCIIAWALQQKVLETDERLHCENGVYRMGRRVLHDHHAYGELSLIDVLAKSSNIGMAKIGERLTNSGLSEGVHVFGFGKLTGIELPGELPGIVHPFERWTSYSTGSIPMGQEICVTPLQMIVAYGALANGGRLIAPRLVHQVGNETVMPVTSQIIRPEIARWVVEEALTQVVETGTGKKARLEGYRVFGKTGTAQKMDPETGAYSHRRHVSSFLCGAPAEDPRVLVIVSVDEPSTAGDHYGGTVAAPPATIILERALHHLQVEPLLQADRSENIQRK